jgi:hypothetical protein
VSIFAIIAVFIFKNRPKLIGYGLIAPEKTDTDLIFAVHQDNAAHPKNMYFGMVKDFEKALDSMGKGSREDGSNGIRREIMLHSFRFVIFANSIS